MKLIGSMMEDGYREELVATHEFHFSADSRSWLKAVLEANGHPTKRSYIVGCIPEQGEDIFTVLISGDYLVQTEIPRGEKIGSPVVERFELQPYLRGISRREQIRLLVAKDLANGKT